MIILPITDHNNYNFFFNILRIYFFFCPYIHDIHLYFVSVYFLSRYANLLRIYRSLFNVCLCYLPTCFFNPIGSMTSPMQPYEAVAASLISTSYHRP